MSKEALTKAIQRSISDVAFRRQLATDATGALRGYDLTAEEINAMRTRDVAKLTAFGIDQRMSKVFLDPGIGGTSATLTSGGVRDEAPVWIGDGSTSREGALASGVAPRDTPPVWIGDGSDATRPLHTYSGDENAGPEGALASGQEPRDEGGPTWIGENTGGSSDGVATDEGQLTNDVDGSGHIQITTGDGDRDQ